jgi:putative glutamine amidotransferase
MKPVIGLTVNYIGPEESGCPSRFGSYYINRGYVEGVRKAGGIPLYLPYTDDPEELRTLLARIDGLILTGGKDMDPKHFGEAIHPTCERILPDRSAFEVRLTQLAVEHKVPTLGICLGLQTLNVAMGGSLFQDIPSMAPSDVRHRQTEAERDTVAHTVEVVEGSMLHQLFGRTELHVNSIHHQAAKKVAPGLVVSARAPDGIIEGLELPTVPFCVSVQWHPEDLKAGESNQVLFDGLVRAAREFRARA